MHEDSGTRAPSTTAHSGYLSLTKHHQNNTAPGLDGRLHFELHDSSSAFEQTPEEKLKVHRCPSHLKLCDEGLGSSGAADQAIYKMVTNVAMFCDLGSVG